MDDMTEYGFESDDEFHRMVANVDISSGEKFAAFKAWQRNDGTKEGLQKLPTVNR